MFIANPASLMNRFFILRPLLMHAHYANTARSPTCRAVIRVYDAGNVIETHEHKGGTHSKGELGYRRVRLFTNSDNTQKRGGDYTRRQPNAGADSSARCSDIGSNGPGSDTGSIAHDSNTPKPVPELNKQH